MTDMQAKRHPLLASGVAMVTAFAGLAGLVLPACSGRTETTTVGTETAIPVTVATVTTAV